MEMRDMAAQLKSLEIDIYESFLVHFILNYLPSEYSHFKILLIFWPHSVFGQNHLCVKML
jgi:hypothetical protein